MATTVYTPSVAYVASIEAGRALPATGTLTFALNVPSIWQITVPIIVKAPNTANNSSGPLVFVFRSADGGTTYDTIALQSIGFARPAAAQQQSMSLRLEGGNYQVCVVMGGGQASTWSVQALTQQVLTAILGV